jgi:hypothetical protein
MGVDLTFQPHLVPRLRTGGEIPLLPLIPSWRAENSFTFILLLAYLTVNGLRHRLVLYRDVVVIVVQTCRIDTAYGGRKSFVIVIAGDTCIYRYFCKVNSFNIRYFDHA